MAVSEGVHLSGLARKLVMDGLIDESDAQTAFKESLSQNVPFVAHVVAQGLADASKIAHAAADEVGAARMDINAPVRGAVFDERGIHLDRLAPCTREDRLAHVAEVQKMSTVTL